MQWYSPEYVLKVYEALETVRSLFYQWSGLIIAAIAAVS